MDFLPVNDSYNQRLQYTQSYVLPDGGLPMHGFGLENQSIIHNSIQDDGKGRQKQMKFQHISTKIDRQQEKVRSDIDEYIKRKSSKIIESPVSSNVNRSGTSLIHLDNQPNNNSKPSILQSKVESIQISQSGSFKKIPPQFAETNDHMELPVIKQSDLERLNSSNGIQPLVALEQSRSQSAVLPLHRKLQQSSVIINLESQVRNNQQLFENVQLIHPVDSLTESISNNCTQKHSRNIQKVPVAYSAQQQVENIRQSQKKEVSSIQINELLSQFIKEKESVYLKRSLQQTNNIATNPKQIIIPNQIPQIQSFYNAVPLQRSLLFDKHLQPIQVNFEQTQDYLHQSQRSKLKRKIDHPVDQQAINIDLEPSQEYYLNHSSKNSMKRHLQALPNQKIFNTEIQQPIPVNLSKFQQQSLQNSMKNSLKRNLQIPVSQKHIEIELYSLEEDRKTMVNPHMVRFFGHTFQDNRIPQKFINMNEQLNESIHLNENLETMETPKNLTMQKRDLRNYPVNQANPQLPILLDQSHRIIEHPRSQIINETKSIHIDLEPSEEKIKSQTQALTKRNLKAGTVPSLQGVKNKVEKVICEGWNPVSHIFKLFKIPSTTRHTGQISFKRSRINTASLLH